MTSQLISFIDYANSAYQSYLENAVVLFDSELLPESAKQVLMEGDIYRYILLPFISFFFQREDEYRI